MLSVKRISQASVPDHFLRAASKTPSGSSTPEARAGEDCLRLLQCLDLVVPRLLPHVKVIEGEVARLVEVLRAVGELEDVFDRAPFVGLVLRLVALVLDKEIIA